MPEWAIRPLGAVGAAKSAIALLIWAPEPVLGLGDGEVMRLAGRQRGVVHRDQLLLADVSRHAIAHRLRNGWLHTLHRDVYLVGRPRIEPFGRELAAVLHFKGFAIVSHASAAALFDLAEPPTVPALTIVGRDAHSRPTCTVRRATRLHRDDITVRHGLPVTSPARTLLDRAKTLPPEELESEFAQLLRRRLVARADVNAAIDRAPHKSGVARLRALASSTRAQSPTLTRSHYERKLKRLLKAADLPPPRVNDRVLGHEVDFHWPQHKLIVEFDGFAFHADRKSFENDRLRDQKLIAAGYRVIRITARQLDQTPYAVTARIAAALAVSPATSAAA